MSRWATNPISHSEPAAPPESGGRRGTSLNAGSTFARRTLGKIAPFFLAAAFFLSGFFTVFAPMPILLLHFSRGRWLAMAAALTNLAIVWLTAGALNAFAFGIMAVVVSMTLGELLTRKTTLERAVTGTLVMMLFVSATVVGALAIRSPQGFGSGFVSEMNQRIKQAVELVLTAERVSSMRGTANAPQTDSKTDSAPAITATGTPADPIPAPAAEEVDAMRANVLETLPSAIAIFSLVLVVANAILCLKLNPRGIRKRLALPAQFLREWRAPELLVWPTLAAGAASLGLEGSAGIWATGFLRFFLAIYCFQGLSILAFFFESWGLRPMFRWVGWACATFFMMPFVLSLGFFDLWFNFRSRFRPANQS